MKCPGCGGELEGLETFCHTCDKYVADMGTTSDTQGSLAHASIDDHRIPDDRVEDQIQEAGRKVLELLGFTVYSLSQDRATRQTPGIADTYVVGHGRTTWAEWKRPGTALRPGQVLFEKDVTANGAEYHVWRHELEAAEWAKAVIEAGKLERAELDRNDPHELAGR